MKTTTVKCDWCAQDITSTSNCEDYRLALVVESKHRESGIVTDMEIDPPINKNAHFCDVPCLKKWLDNGMQPNEKS